MMKFIFPLIFILFFLLLLFTQPKIDFINCNKVMEQGLSEFFNKSENSENSSDNYSANKNKDSLKYLIDYNFVNVRKNNSTKSPVVFKLFKGMEIIPKKTLEIQDVIWIKIGIGAKQSDYYWVELPKNTNCSVETNSILTTEKILVIKSKRILYIINRNKEKFDTIKTYSVALGQAESSIKNNINSRKRLTGDNKTPEGLYYIAGINPASSYGKDPKTGAPLSSLLISYPNEFDAWFGLQNGYIGIAQYNRICQAVKNKVTPLQNTALGGLIMIHGGGGAKYGDWTFGCIALDNEDMKELLNLVNVGTSIEIRK